MDVFEIDYDQILRDDYKQHKSLYVAYDYDNTVFDYHKKGVCYDKIIDLLIICKSIGFKLILFTANEGSKLEVVINDLETRKIPYDFINENPIMKTRKPYYNILLDDRSGLNETYTRLKKITDEIRNKEI